MEPRNHEKELLKRALEHRDELSDILDAETHQRLNAEAEEAIGQTRPDQKPLPR